MWMCSVEAAVIRLTSETLVSAQSEALEVFIIVNVEASTLLGLLLGKPSKLLRRGRRRIDFGEIKNHNSAIAERLAEGFV